MIPDEAVNVLAQYGLNPTFWGGEENRIIGVLNLTDPILGTDISERYSIYQWDGLWISAILDPFPRGTTLWRSADLGEVVNATCQFYDRRQITTTNPISVETAINLLIEGGLDAVSSGGVNIWGGPSQQETARGESKTGRYGIGRHAGAWLAVHIKLEGSCDPIHYSGVLLDVVQAVIRFFHPETP